MQNNLEYFESYREVAIEVKNKVQEKFPERKIKQLRIGRNPDGIDVIFLIVDVADRSLQEFQRELECQIYECELEHKLFTESRFQGMIWSVSDNDNLCYDTINVDFPLIVFKAEE